MSTETDMLVNSPRRRAIVGRDQNGNSAVLKDETRAPHVSLPNVSVTELWKLRGLPADYLSVDDNCAGAFELVPPKGGCTIRVVDLPPDRNWKGATSSVGQKLADEEGFHQTDTIDFIIVVSGTVWCRSDTDEILLNPGDSLVQLGARHAWSVRGDEPCRMIAVLFDAQPGTSEN